MKQFDGWHLWPRRRRARRCVPRAGQDLAPQQAHAGQDRGLRVRCRADRRHVVPGQHPVLRVCAAFRHVRRRGRLHLPVGDPP